MMSHSKSSRSQSILWPHSFPKAFVRRMRILIAEDNAFNQKVVLRQVREMGFGADAVGVCIEALKALNIIPYDLVLMDCLVCRRWTATPVPPKSADRKSTEDHTPIIAMTAHVMKTDRDKCLAAGMDDF